MKLSKLIGISALISASYYAFTKYRDYREFKTEEEAILREMIVAAGEYDGPRFDVGDPVIIRNPYVEVTTVDDTPVHAVVEEIAYIQGMDAYTYRVTGSTAWYNENWLEYDEYGPATFVVAKVRDLAEEMDDERRVNVDYWLRSYSYEKSQGNAAEAEKALSELRKLSNE